jgi:hypothetical protein
LLPSKPVSVKLQPKGRTCPSRCATESAQACATAQETSNPISPKDR